MPFLQQNKNSVWRRLYRNKSGLTGAVVICVACIVALFAYYIAPDHSPDANRIIPEIARKEPGFSIDLVQFKKDSTFLNRGSFFGRLLNGQADNYFFIPVTSWYKTSDSIIAQKFVDDGITERVSYALDKLANEPVITKKFFLGTDNFGRDIASRIIIGTRVSLSVGFIAVIISLGLGILLGALAGFYGGRTDNIIMWLINVVWSIPTLLLVFAITLLLGKGFWQVFIAVGLTMWVNVARLVRGQIKAAKELEYVQAARVLGFSDMRIIFLHILPNIFGPVMVIAAGNFASAIVMEAGLSFLGVGVQPPKPSWGLMIKEQFNFIVTNHPLLALEPGIAIMILVLAFNLLGNGLRDALNVKEQV